MPAPPVFDLAAIAARLARASHPALGTERTARAAVAAVLRDASRSAAEATSGASRSAAEAVSGASRSAAEAISDVEVLLIRRAERAGDPWSGHMAFPGGRHDAADADLRATAVRETREEVGIDLDAHGALLGRLPDIDAVARGRRMGLIVTPFVFALARDVPLAFDAEEVAEAIWVPLAPLARGEGAGTLAWEVEGVTLDLPCWRVGEHVVWGLTYRMIQSLFEALAS